MRISDWSSDVCSSDLIFARFRREIHARYPFVSSEVETPLGGARPHGISTSLDANGKGRRPGIFVRSEEHTSELQSLMRISYAVFCLKKKNSLMTNNVSTSYTIHHTTLKYSHHKTIITITTD